MKKLLAFILSVIMVLSIMPMAYAKRAEYSPEIEAYIEDYIRAYAYCYSVYESEEQYQEVREIFIEARVIENAEIYPSYENLINIEADGRLDELTALHEAIKKGIDEVEKKIAAAEFVIVVDSYEYYKLVFPSIVYYSDEVQKELSERVENFKSDKFINTRNEALIGLDMISEMLNFGYYGIYIYTQADFDAAMAKYKPFCDSFFACLDGDHPYGEYISDNNATEDADGTKTATCEFCGATDTIVDEGTKLPKEEASLYEKLFDLIKDFIALIISMFNYK